MKQLGKSVTDFAKTTIISSGITRKEWPPAPTVLTVVKDSVFAGRVPGNEHTVFDVIAADMDLDGDLDLYANGHVEFHSELFENLGGHFQHVNIPGSDHTGLFDNPGIPNLYADADEMVALINRAGAPGLYFWHDLDRHGVWRFRIKGAASLGEFILTVRLNSPVAQIEGLDGIEYERPNKFEVRIPLTGKHADRSFGIGANGKGDVTTQAKMALSTTSGNVPLPLFAGAERIRIESGQISVWKQDPHGMAWAQVEGSPEPELFVTRGGMRGDLMPPHEPKTDRLFLWRGQDDAHYQQAANGVIPGNYERGRKVEWVDIDNDGINELYVSNSDGPNNLLIRDPKSGAYRNHASLYGLGFKDGEVFTWMDWDDDGFQDLLFIVEDQLVVAHNLEGNRFEIVSASDFGVVLPNPPPKEKRNWLDLRELHLLDFDNDGQLDILLSGCEPGLTNHLYRRQGDVYVDVTKSVNLAPIDGTVRLVILDVDNDGFVDIISLGEDALLLRNQHGKRFEPGRLWEEWSAHPEIAATTGDFNNDGRIDLVFVDESPHLAVNSAESDNQFLFVHFSPAVHEPIGALVRAYYADGSVQVQRYGSSHNTRFSQALQPLHFGIPSTTSLDSIGIRWPGTSKEVRYPIQAGQTSLRPDR